MKIKAIFSILAVAAVLITGCGETANKSLVPEMVTLSSQDDSLSYAWGVNIGSFLMQRNFTNINVEVFAEAAIAAHDSAPVLISPEEAQAFLANAKPEAAAPVAAGALDSISYAWGVNIGNFLMRENHTNIDAAIIAFVIKQLKSELPTLMTNEQAQKYLMDYTQREQRKLAGPERQKGADFLAENATKEGVMTTASGMQYKVNIKGTGPVAKPGETVVAHYHGTLLDGTVFDSSVERNQPFEFAVGTRQVIQGWDEAFGMMPVGSSWTLYIPADLAYGDNPRPGGAIKPGMLLIFDVQLLDIKPVQ